jgi:hypothetical protein
MTLDDKSKKILDAFDNFLVACELEPFSPMLDTLYKQAGTDEQFTGLSTQLTQLVAQQLKDQFGMVQSLIKQHITPEALAKMMGGSHGDANTNDST